MLKIRRVQMEAFSADRMRQFENRVIEYLAVTFPEATQKMGEMQLRKLIEDGVIKADGYGIQSEKYCSLFIQLMVVFDPMFDKQPEFSWMQPILSHPTRPEEVKIEMLYEQLKDKAPQFQFPNIE